MSSPWTRPVAAMNALSFGSPDHLKTRQLVHGVVEQIGGYGNCFGVPTVGGEVRLHPAYKGNYLINAFAIGLANADKIFYSAASGVGMLVINLAPKRAGMGLAPPPWLRPSSTTQAKKSAQLFRWATLSPKSG